MKVKLSKLERATARGNEARNWEQEVKGLNAYFERDDHKKYILHFCETLVCTPTIKFDGVDMKLDGITYIGFKKCGRLGALQNNMIEQVRERIKQ